ncbi:tannase/feruloyl esterase family alpha/beta hydrolase [Variovorax sp. J22P240]|uniref:tannase/feruloyl esterase family alpha/beta hydrolase n=1 Tax=Variovorax sp. J22P240 TaxID=3053514 RepID=UPI0025790252|nr:tannase/feruloyl esterase family alpha/beta hydrolase [Variovorax sp. J22P240]MDL9997713.1 tannase/feruloyl esterase family alpha/beta hydrolase [Variovorax sp. J22P240]
MNRAITVLRIRPRTAPGLREACVLGIAALTGTAQAAWDCPSLTAVTTADATITSATLTDPPAVIGGASVAVQFCRVQGIARPSSDSEIKFEVWLPPSAGDWNRRMKVNGTGGYAGSIPYARLAQDVADGIVSAGSNMGHDGGESATWTLNRPEKVKDWGLRAHYSVATAAKALSNAFYAEPVKYSYFEGCSNGGRQALMMAQNYPELFDGIVAGAPSNFYPDLLMWLLWTGKNLTPSAPFGPPSVSTAKRQAVTQRVLQACDALDGAADGQITNPRACRFDIDNLGPSGDGTLTAPELAVFKAMYAGTTSEAGVQRYTGARLGSEADWSPLFADNGGYGPFIGHYVYSQESPPFDWRRDINFSNVYDVVKQTLTPVTAAPSPDLRAFTRRGGKIIQYHGWNDSVVPPDGSIGYYYALTQFEWLKSLPPRVADRLIDDLSPQAVEATALAFGRKVREYHRLFMLPAVGHCGGSTGPSAIGGGAPEPPKAFRNADTHVVSAVMKWVEQGVAPEKIVASAFDATGNVVRQRPVCPYPAQAVYENGGDLDSAESFTCKTPRPRDIDVEAGDMLHIRNSLTQRGLLLPHR